MNRFGQYLARKLRERGMTQSELAQRAGISDAHVSRLRKEARGLPKIETLARLASSLRMSLQEMLRELAIIGPETSDLPESLQEFLKSSEAPPDITADETETLASQSAYEGAATTPQGYRSLLEELRRNPLHRVERLLTDQPAEIREAVARLVEAYIAAFGETR